MSDYEELKQFKADSDAKQFKLEIDSITEKYSLDTEDAKTLQDTVLKHEISKEEYEGKLAIMWAKQVKEAQSFSKTKTGKANSIGIINPNEEFIDSNAPYGGRLENGELKIIKQEVKFMYQILTYVEDNFAKSAICSTELKMVK